MKKRARNYKYHWETILYENQPYDVCIALAVEEADEIRPSDSEINIIPVMEIGVINWMTEQALEAIEAEAALPPCRSMNKKLRLIEGV